MEFAIRCCENTGFSDALAPTRETTAKRMRNRMQGCQGIS
jgi:hypothetical protein